MEVSEIKDEDSLKAWLKGQSREDAGTIASRATARVFPLFLQEMEKGWISGNSLDCFPVVRALFISSQNMSNKWEEREFTSFAANAPRIAESAARIAYRAYNYAAEHRKLKPASESAFQSVDLAFEDVAAAKVSNVAHAVSETAISSDVAGSSIRAIKRSFAASFANARQLFAEVVDDAYAVEEENSFVGRPLWTSAPLWFSKADTRARAIWAKEPQTWEFWVRWWDGVIAGKPLDWELQKQVALIPDEDWKKGPEHIAALIRKIEAGRADTPDISQAPKPDSTDHLTQNRLAARMTAEGLAGQIAAVIERYHGDTGCNDLPEEFQALKPLPSVLETLGRKLADASTTEDALRAEIQRLNAHVLQLEADLAEAKAKTVKGLMAKNFAEQTGKSLGDWKMWGALIGGIGYLGGVPAIVDATHSIADSVLGIFGDKPPTLPVPDIASPTSPPVLDV